MFVYYRLVEWAILCTTADTIPIATIANCIMCLWLMMYIRLYCCAAIHESKLQDLCVKVIMQSLSHKGQVESLPLPTELKKKNCHVSKHFTIVAA